MLDLSYEEDSRAEVDANFVMTGGRKLVEVQCSAEQRPFDDAQLQEMIVLARGGVEQLIARQQTLLSGLTLMQ
jgi:ribonuclease PH